MSGKRLSVTRPCPIPVCRVSSCSYHFPFEWREAGESNIPSVILPPSLTSVPRFTNPSNALPGGSANQHCTLPSLFSFRYLVTPASVPPVPVAQMNAVSPPGSDSVCE